MLIDKLAVQNFGIFRGRHEFNLAPLGSADGPNRHVTLITGHNGAGKSTLFQALNLALFGPLSLGNRVSRQSYADFLYGSLHRFGHNGQKAVSAEGGVAVGLTYVQSGRPLRLSIERRWRRTQNTVHESLDVLRDGNALDVDGADYQTWIQDLIPPGLATLCLFDAEQINTFASPEDQRESLADTVRRLLGLDLVERLQADLESYTLRQGGKLRAEPLRENIHHCQAALDALDERLAECQARADALSKQAGELRAALAHQERRLAAEGGGYAARRPVVQERLEAVKQEMEGLSNTLRELSGELLPFALAPELCERLSRRLAEEAGARRSQMADGVLEERASELVRALENPNLWEGVKLSAKARRAFAERLARAARDAMKPRKGPEKLLHHLADTDQEQVQSWLVLALHAIPQQVGAIGERLRKLQHEQRALETDLQRAPNDETLAPIHGEITRLQAALAETQREETPALEQVSSTRLQHEEQARLLQRAAEQLAAVQTSEHQFALAERSKLVLRVYQDSLTRQRLAALEDALVAAFNAICRKEHLLGGARISAEDFSVELYGVGDDVIALGDFSAGERQLYALALLWALRRVSGRQLPLAVDTPLARLDEIHRSRLVHDYFPLVSDQVLLFATDVEFDEALRSEIAPYLAREYRLGFDASSGSTQVNYAGGVLPEAELKALDAEMLS